MRPIHEIKIIIKTKYAVRLSIALAILSSIIVITSCTSVSPVPQVNESIKLSESSQAVTNTQPSENLQSSSNPRPSELPSPDIKEQLAAFPEDYSSEQALEDGFLVFNNSRNPDVAIGEKFIKAALAGKPASLLIYQSTTEGDPILSQVNYDGEMYQYSVDNSRDKFAGQSADKYWESSYAYLVIYEQDEGRYVFLMQDDDVTYEDLLISMTSSSSPARIDCQFLFVMPDEEQAVD